MDCGPVASLSPIGGHSTAYRRGQLYRCLSWHFRSRGSRGSRFTETPRRTAQSLPVRRLPGWPGVRGADPARTGCGLRMGKPAIRRAGKPVLPGVCAGPWQTVRLHGVSSGGRNLEPQVNEFSGPRLQSPTFSKISNQSWGEGTSLRNSMGLAAASPALAVALIRPRSKRRPVAGST